MHSRFQIYVPHILILKKNTENYAIWHNELVILQNHQMNFVLLNDEHFTEIKKKILDNCANIQIFKLKIGSQWFNLK